MMHWHIHAKYFNPTTALSGATTLWHKATAEEEVHELNVARIELGYNDFVWHLAECESLECLIDALAR